MASGSPSVVVVRGIPKVVVLRISVVVGAGISVVVVPGISLVVRAGPLFVAVSLEASSFDSMSTLASCISIPEYSLCGTMYTSTVSLFAMILNILCLWSSRLFLFIEATNSMIYT